MKPVTQNPKTVFLARRGYRQRRLRDALRVLPVLAVILWLFPLLWQTSGDAASLANVVVYVFVVWFVMIAAAAAMSHKLEDTPEAEAGEEQG